MAINHTSQYSELTDDQFKIIGKIVIEWSNIEFLQKLILCRLLLTNDFLGRTFTDHISAARVQEAINEGVQIQLQRYQGRLISKTVLKELSALNKEVTQIRGKRNKFAHFCWSRSNDQEIFGTNFSGGVPDSKKAKRGALTLSLKELQKLYQQSYELVEKISAILEKLPEIKENELIERR